MLIRTTELDMEIKPARLQVPLLSQSGWDLVITDWWGNYRRTKKRAFDIRSLPPGELHSDIINRTILISSSKNSILCVQIKTVTIIVAGTAVHLKWLPHSKIFQKGEVHHQEMFANWEFLLFTLSTEGIDMWLNNVHIL